MAEDEQGMLPYERSLAKEEDVEEERRLAFVGITRAKEELYLCHARLREFRGQTLYAVPSMFLDELPEEGTASTGLSARSYGSPQAIEQWRTGSKAAEQGWADAGVLPRTRAELLEPKSGRAPAPFGPSMIGLPPTYGQS